MARIVFYGFPYNLYYFDKTRGCVIPCCTEALLRGAIDFRAPRIYKREDGTKIVAASIECGLWSERLMDISTCKALQVEYPNAPVLTAEEAGR